MVTIIQNEVSSKVHEMYHLDELFLEMTTDILTDKKQELSIWCMYANFLFFRWFFKFFNTIVFFLYTFIHWF